MASVIAGSTLCRAAAPEPEHAPRRERRRASRSPERGRSPTALVAAVAEVEEPCALSVTHRPPGRRPRACARAARAAAVRSRGRPRRRALRRGSPSAAPRRSTPPSTVTLVAARGEDRRELLRAFVDLDHEPFRAAAHVGERSRRARPRRPRRSRPRRRSAPPPRGGGTRRRCASRTRCRCAG